METDRQLVQIESAEFNDEIMLNVSVLLSKNYTYCDAEKVALNSVLVLNTFCDDKTSYDDISGVWTFYFKVESTDQQTEEETEEYYEDDEDYEDDEEEEEQEEYTIPSDYYENYEDDDDDEDNEFDFLDFN